MGLLPRGSPRSSDSNKFNKPILVAFGAWCLVVLTMDADINDAQGGKGALNKHGILGLLCSDNPVGAEFGALGRLGDVDDVVEVGAAKPPCKPSIIL